eukprot:1161676-Pelagomonas_calceolata.AAC.6
MSAEDDLVHDAATGNHSVSVEPAAVNKASQFIKPAMRASPHIAMYLFTLSLHYVLPPRILPCI